MNKLYKIIVGMFCLFMVNEHVLAQAFQKGSLLISLSEGGTNANFSTADMRKYSDVAHNEHIIGTRDPIILEYGLSKHWGIGLTSGADFYNIDPSSFYGFPATNKIKAFMTEFTVDGNYHFFVTKKLDLSGFVSLGLSSVNLKGNSGDMPYKYNSCGTITRAGIKARYYFLWRFGVFGMLSAFSDHCSSIDEKGNTVGQGYATSIKGTALEFGLCCRILR